MHFDSGFVRFQLTDIMHFVTPFPGWNEAGQNQTDDTVPHRNGVADFEFRFVRAAYQGSAWCFLHLSILAHCENREHLIDWSASVTSPPPSPGQSTETLAPSF